ncbi:DUF1345 domain-containing protein [Agrococcus sp. 1P02AA]|uniref:DUF1345 domain-containing protein n=1 Tax=Agrococcus sp. 1P02AA TaxID=3132259 RepID=UPI0039A63075
MEKLRAVLQREYVRHLAATLIAAALAYVITAAAHALFGEPLAAEPFTLPASAFALVFGVYGPSFLLLSHLAFGSLRGERLRARVRRSEERSALVRHLLLGGPASWSLTIVIVGVASVLLLAAGSAAVDLWLIVRCVLGVAGTWVLLVAVFAVDHMRGWADHDGLRFPGDDERSFSDFVYVSTQLSTTFSSSDVQLTNRPARSLATVQSVVGFAYSTVIIAVFASLLISLAA